MIKFLKANKENIQPKPVRKLTMVEKEDSFITTAIQRMRKNPSNFMTQCPTNSTHSSSTSVATSPA